jgi:hypothetical protein
MVGAVGPEHAEKVRALDAADDRPGFDCAGGFGGIAWTDIQFLGGSLIGGDFPADFGRPIKGGSTIILNIHYSTVLGNAVDQTALEFRLDAAARETRGIPIANPAWLIGDALHIPAGEPDAVFWYHYDPVVLTRHQPVDIWGVTPHMHYFGSRQVVRIIRADGTRECLLEIPEWHFGAEQVFWLEAPVRLAPGDEVYVECHFDNSAENQPVRGSAPRDIAWGGDNQDMCAAFLTYVEAP